MRLTISGHLDGFCVRAVTRRADTILATYRTFEAAANALRALRERLSTTPTKEA